jgi:hypothetical protein
LYRYTEDDPDEDGWYAGLDLEKLRTTMRDSMRLGAAATAAAAAAAAAAPTPDEEETLMAGIGQLAGRMLNRSGGAYNAEEDEEEDGLLGGLDGLGSAGFRAGGGAAGEGDEGGWGGGWNGGVGGVRGRADPLQYVGIDPVQAAKAELDEVNRRLDHSRRNLAFVSATAAALRKSAAECSVCFERLRGKAVTVLRCLHAFDHGGGAVQLY